MQPIFSRNADYRKIAFMNWRVDHGGSYHDFWAMANGYLNAAVSLAQLCLTSNKDKKADIYIFPIFMNANHGIELYLKAINWTLHILTQSGKTIERGHNIKTLYQNTVSKFTQFQGAGKAKEFKHHTQNLRIYIDELFTRIQNQDPKKDNMDFSRYPFNTAFENHFYLNIKGPVEIDLENFAGRIQLIQTSLQDIMSSLVYDELPLIEK